MNRSTNLFYTDQIASNLLLPAHLADLFRFLLDAIDGSSAVTTFNALLTLEISYHDEDVAATGGSEDKAIFVSPGIARRQVDQKTGGLANPRHR